MEERQCTQTRLPGIGEVLKDLLTGIGASTDEAGGPVRITGGDPYISSPHRLATAATAAIATHAVTAAALCRERGGAGQAIDIDARDAMQVLHTGNVQRYGGYPSTLHYFICGAVTGMYRTADDRWVMMVGTYPHQRDGILELLGTPNTTAAIGAAVRGWGSAELEEAMNTRGLPAVTARSAEQWRATEQGALLATRPLIELERIGDGEPVSLPRATRPTGGVRVLDLTHLIAGPIATRSLAEHGAEVLHISAPHLPDPDLMSTDAGLGKRYAHLDLRRADDLSALKRLLWDADIFVQSFRPGVLDGFGLSPAELCLLRPGIITVSVSLYGEEGPWATRAGFDQIAQTATGIAVTEGGSDYPRLVPTYLFTDYVVGYLAAAGAQQALRLRARHGGSWSVRVNLARTSMWLQDLGLLTDHGSSSPGQFDCSLRPLEVFPARWNNV